MKRYGQIDERKTYKIRLPQTLTHAKQLIGRRPADNKVLCEINAPDAIKPADERLARFGLQSRDDRTDKVRAEALLVQRAADQIGEGARGDVPLLAQAVEVGLVAEEIRHGGHVGR